MSLPRWPIILAIIVLLAGVAFLLRPAPSTDPMSGSSTLLPSGATGPPTSPDSKPQREQRIRKLSPDELALEKLETIIVPSVDFEDVTLPEALDFIRSRTRELDNATTDPAKRGIRLVVRRTSQDLMKLLESELGGDPEPDAIPSDRAVEPSARLIKDLRLSNVTTLEVLNEICAQTEMAWKVESGVVVLSAVGEISE